MYRRITRPYFRLFPLSARAATVFLPILFNGYLDSQLAQIKQEPLSEDEANADLPKDCLLCSKQFLTLSGLKAHVMTHHNYKTVKRKFDGSISPAKKQDSSTEKSVMKYICQICKRNFTTSTDLKVHEVCHDKFTCFACDSKFETFKAVTQHRRWCKAKVTAVKPPKTLTDILKERKAQKELAAAIFENDPEHWECCECNISFYNIHYYKLHNLKHHPNSQDLQTLNKEMVEIEINLKQEIQDVEDKKIKQEKEDAEYKKIETELESMFENPSESEKSCASVKSEQLKESGIPQSDPDNIESILSSVTVNNGNGENEQLNTGEAFKHDSKDKNKSAIAFNDINSNLKETGTNIDARQETNNEKPKFAREDTSVHRENIDQNDDFSIGNCKQGILPQDNNRVSEQNDYQHDSNLKANLQDIQLTQESGSGIKEKYDQNDSNIENDDKSTQLIRDNDIPNEIFSQNVSITDTNKQNVLEELTQEDYSIPKENVTRNDLTIETNDGEELSQENHNLLGEKVNQEVATPCEIEINIDVNVDSNNVYAHKDHTRDDSSDVKESDSQNCNEVAQSSETRQIEDEPMDVEASADNNNENQNKELDNTDKHELKEKNNGDSKVNEKTDLVE